MIVVAGSLLVDPGARDAYLEGCREVVAAAREAEGCLDFALSPDLLEPGRINVLERWESAAALERFRGSGPPDDQLTQLLEIRVGEYEVGVRERTP
jgi:quinol monooxygenase YgiN